VKRFRLTLLAFAVALAAALPLSQAGASTAETKRYIVVFAGDYAVDGTYAVESTYAVLCNYAVTGSYAVGDDYAVGCNYAVTDLYAVYAVAHQYAVSLVQGAGGTVVGDMLKETGTMIVHSSNELFDETMRSYAVVDEAAEDYVWQGVPSYAVGTQDECPDPPDPTNEECLPEVPGDPVEDPLEAAQWDMEQICVVANAEWGCPTRDAHDEQKGNPAVQVGILDTGIDGRHVDLAANVNCGLGRNSINAMVGLPDEETNPGIGTPDPCMDNNFHGTHVAGTVAANDNSFGIVGVAPDVTLIPVKVCDASGFCYASAVVDGITYAGKLQFEVINMSFFVDDNKFQESEEFKCSDNPLQRTFRHAVERAIQYARNQGVTPVAALGNSDQDLADPQGVDEATGKPYTNRCDVVPAETQGVIGTMALGRNSQKAPYSNYGDGMTDVAAPGGAGTTGDCFRTVLSTMPLNTYACIQGTSMASPHAAGVAALIVAEFGTMGTDGDWKLSPTKVESYLQASAVDLYNPGAPHELKGYDKCFGNGRIHALRAVLKDTSVLRDDVPLCADGQANT
jgi:subtilisin family serine protease